MRGRRWLTGLPRGLRPLAMTNTLRTSRLLFSWYSRTGNKAVLRRTASLNREPLAAALSNTPLKRLACVSGSCPATHSRHVPYRELFSDINCRTGSASVIPNSFRNLSNDTGSSQHRAAPESRSLALTAGPFFLLRWAGKPNRHSS